MVNCFSYRGIGIRIEDNVVMTETGPYVLTAGLPKEMADAKDALKKEPSRNAIEKDLVLRLILYWIAIYSK